MLNAVAKDLQSIDSVTQIDKETVVNATSVQIGVNIDGVNMLLSGDASFEAISDKINNYNIIQLPHHGKEDQAKSIFDSIEENDFKKFKEILFVISDNTGNSNGGSDNRHFKGKNITNTRTDGDILINYSFYKKRVSSSPARTLKI